MQGTEYYSCCYVAILSNSIRLRSHSSFSLFTLRIRQSSCRAYQEIPPSYFLKPAGGLYFPGILPCSRFRGSIYNSTEVSQVASFRPRRGRTPNNRRWNDRREWNLRIVTDTLLPSPKGANRSKTGCGSPPLGTLSPYYWLSAGSMTFGHSTSGY